MRYLTGLRKDATKGIYPRRWPGYVMFDEERDEFGEIYLDVEGREPVLLRRHQGMTVPKGTMHRPRSTERSAVLMVESAGIVPLGD